MLLEARRHVHRVAAHHQLAARSCFAAGHDLARVDADPQPDLGVVPLEHAFREHPERVAHRQRRAHGPLGVVLVGLRDAEGRHDGVAGELLHDPAVGDHAMGDALEEGLDTAAHDLGIGAPYEGRRIHEVDEQDRGELAFHASSVGTNSARRSFPRIAQTELRGAAAA